MSGRDSENTSNDVIEGQLRDLLGHVEDDFEADAITFRGSLIYGADDLIRNFIEEIDPKRQRLLVILETDGGSIDVAERIANTFRHFYSEVDFLIPNFAYSAGTILAMSGDSIHMDYYSVLGPIDPQVRKEGVGWVPALGYLLKYEELVNKSANGDLTQAEAAFLCSKFDPAELHAFEQAKEQSITLLKEWLVKYKFKDWSETEARKIPVDETMKRTRAAEIAEKLNKTDLWHSHNRGIPMQALRDVLNLKIHDFGEHDPRRSNIRSYYKLLRDYMMRRGHDGALQTKKKYTQIGG